MKKKNHKIRVGLLGAMVLSGIFLAGCTDTEVNEHSTASSESIVTEESISNTQQESGEDKLSTHDKYTAIAETNRDWESVIKDIIENEEKSNRRHAVDFYAYSYSSSPEERAQFEADIIGAFVTDEYLRDISDDVYMLTNLFKSYVVFNFYKDVLPIPMGDFAFDFLQNVKYTYAGVDAVDSESVLSNELQMQRALDEMN